MICLWFPGMDASSATLCSMCVCGNFSHFHDAAAATPWSPGLLQLSLAGNNFVRPLTNELGRKNLASAPALTTPDGSRQLLLQDATHANWPSLWYLPLGTLCLAKIDRAERFIPKSQVFSPFFLTKISFLFPS